MQKYIDLHSHSSHSPDADHSVADMCRAAEQKGLYAYAVTDHCEMNDFIGGGYVNTIPASLEEMERTRSGRFSNPPGVPNAYRGKPDKAGRPSEAIFSSLYPHTPARCRAWWNQI